MKIELQSQLRAYAEHIDAASSPVTTNDVLTRDPAAHAPVRSPWLLKPTPSKLPGWVYAIAAAVATLLLVGGISWVLGPRTDVEPVDQPPISTPAPSIHAPTDDASTLPTETIATGPLQVWMSPPVGSNGAIWVADASGETVLRIDAATREVTDRISVNTCQDDGGCQLKLFATDDAVWALVRPIPRIGGGELVRIDPDRNEVTDRTPIPGIAQPLVLDGALWVQTSNPVRPILARVDFESGQVTEQHRLVANSWWAGVADGAIWSFSAISDPPRISRFDLTEQVFSSIDVDLPITEECCIATDDAIWLVSHINVMRLDTATLEVTEVTALGPGLFRGIAAAGALWLPNPQADTIYRFDPALGQVTDIISVCCEPWKPLFAEGALWVPNQRRANITRINVSTLEVTHVIDVGTRPGTPILYDGAIWVASAEDETVTRIQLP